MQLDANRTVNDVRQRIETHARQEYGDQRVEELSEQIEHLANMMTGVANQSLDLRDEPLSTGPTREPRGDT